MIPVRENSAVVTIYPDIIEILSIYVYVYMMYNHPEVDRIWFKHISILETF